VIDFHSLLPNSVILLKLKNPFIGHINNIKIYLHHLTEKNLIPDFKLCDINSILYKCEQEELDNTLKKRGNYVIPE
jgi:hypothetical protein